MLTVQVIRDTLALQGPMGVVELTSTLNKHGMKVYQNDVMSLLLDLTVTGQVFYNVDQGTYESEVKLV